MASAPRGQVGGGEIARGDQVGPTGGSDVDPGGTGTAERDGGETERRVGDNNDDDWF